jgi:hypothetical protein
MVSDRGYVNFREPPSRTLVNRRGPKFIHNSSLGGLMVVSLNNRRLCKPCGMREKTSTDATTRRVQTGVSVRAGATP